MFLFLFFPTFTFEGCLVWTTPWHVWFSLESSPLEFSMHLETQSIVHRGKCIQQYVPILVCFLAGITFTATMKFATNDLFGNYYKSTLKTFTCFIWLGALMFFYRLLLGKGWLYFHKCFFKLKVHWSICFVPIIRTHCTRCTMYPFVSIFSCKIIGRPILTYAGTGKLISLHCVQCKFPFTQGKPQQPQ